MFTSFTTREPREKLVTPYTLPNKNSTFTLLLYKVIKVNFTSKEFITSTQPIAIMKILYFTSLSLLLTIQSIAQNITFEKVLSPSKLSVFSGVKAGATNFADIDGDNDLDVLITGYKENDNSTGIPSYHSDLYINDGSGIYTVAAGTPFTGVYYSSVDFADIDGDNDLDVIITGNSGSQNISELYTNNGNGTFTLVNGTPFTGVSDGSVKFADIDGDNDQDVLISGAIGQYGKTEFFTNDGLGNFTLVTGTPFQDVKRGSIAFEDVDTDGDQDVLITGYNNNAIAIAELYTNDGSGSFLLASGTPFQGDYRTSVAFADVDGDNDQDVLIAGYNVTKLYKNNWTGTFSLETGFPFIHYDGPTIAFADVDGDNDLDFLVTGGEKSDMYINDGVGNYTLMINTHFSSLGTRTSSLAFGDVDNDNDLDVIITGRSDWGRSITELYINDSTGYFTVQGNPLHRVDSSSTAFADIDGDGDQDLLITGDNGPYDITELYLNDGTGNYQVKKNTPFTGVSNGSVAFADVDGDLDQDVVISGGYTCLLYLNDGSGNYTLLQGTPFPAVINSSVVFADVDGDNDQDLFVLGQWRIPNSNSYNPIANLYINDGSGTFSTLMGTPFNSGSESQYVVADIDGDNDLDVLIVGNGPDLYTNDGSGNYTHVTNPFLQGMNVQYIAAGFADIDGDNDLDVLFTARNAPSELYLNDGNGIFTLNNNTNFNYVHNGTVNFSDIDNDNDQDIIITGNSAGNVFVTEVYINDGTGNFSLLIGTPFAGVTNGVITIADINDNNNNNKDILITGDKHHVDNGGREPTTELWKNTSTSIVKVPEINLGNSFLVYPNPTNDILIIDNLKEVISITVVSTFGNTVISESINSSTTKTTLNVAALPSGIYAVQFTRNNGTSSSKTVVVK